MSNSVSRIFGIILLSRGPTFVATDCIMNSTDSTTSQEVSRPAEVICENISHMHITLMAVRDC